MSAKTIEVYLVESSIESFDQDLQVWLSDEYSTDDVAVYVGRDGYGRLIDRPFCIVWLHPHPTRSRAAEYARQQAVAAAISERVGYAVPLWSANPYRAVDGAALNAQRWAAQGRLVCAACGQEWEGRVGRSGPRYCSGACRQKAFRARAGEQSPA